MKLRTFLFFFICSGCILQASAQYEIPDAQQQPAWVLPLYFTDAVGSMDTLYFGLDDSAQSSAGWPLYPDTAFGERYVPADTLGFRTYFDTNPWWFGLDSVLKVMVSPLASSQYQLSLTLVNARLPVTMYWDSQQFYSESLPFPSQSPFPRVEGVLWPSDLYANYNDPEGNYCGFTEPILLSDTSLQYTECTFTDSVSLNSWDCSGCLFTGDFDLWIREWTGGWVGVNNVSSHDKSSVFPNPSSEGNFNLIWEDIRNRDISVYDAVGREVFKSRCYVNQFSFKLNFEPAGIYLLKVSSGDGVLSTTIIMKN
jgi:hypothetical protein